MPRLTSLSAINPIVGLSAVNLSYSWQLERRINLIGSGWDSGTTGGLPDDISVTSDNEILIGDASAAKAFAFSVDGTLLRDFSASISYQSTSTEFGAQVVKFKNKYFISESLRSSGDVGGIGIVHVLDSDYNTIGTLDDSDANASLFGATMVTDGDYLVIASGKRYTSSYDSLEYRGCLHVYDSNLTEIQEIFYGDVVAPLIPGLSRSDLENNAVWIDQTASFTTSSMTMSNGIVYAYAGHLPADSAASIAGLNNSDYNNGVVLRFDAANGTYLGNTTQPIADRLTGGSGKAESFARGYYNKDAAGPNYFAVGAYVEDSTDGTDQIGKVYAFNASDGSLAYQFQNPSTGNQNLDRFGYFVGTAKGGTQAIITASEDGADTTDRSYVYDFATGGLLQTILDSDINTATQWASNDEYLVGHTSTSKLLVYKWLPIV
jgi:hypothetical protein